MGIGTVHANVARGLVYKLNIDSVPSVVVIINGRVKHMTGVLSIQGIRDFVRSTIPSYTVQMVIALFLCCTSEQTHDILSKCTWLLLMYHVFIST